MAVTVTMPQLGESVTEGTLARWLKQPGEPVAKYESIAEVESDKVNAEIPSPSEGTMGELIAAEGAVVAVGESICTIEGAGEERSPEPSPGHPAKTESAPPQAAAVDESDSPPARRASPSQVLEREQRTVEAQESDQREGPGDGFHLTPAVRMLVREHKVDLSQITGTGLGGRITKKDVLEHVQRRQAASDGEEDTGRGAPPASPGRAAAVSASASARGEAPAAPEVAPAELREGDVVVPLTSARRAIAEHMVRSRHTAPHAWIMVEVDMTSVVRYRSAHKDEFQRRHGVNLTYLPFVARAVVEALRQHPTLNASWSEQGFVLKRDINLGIAVALEDRLIVPVIRQADRLTVTGLATAMADLGVRARANRLKLDEVQGGTFTLNNTGSLGSVASQSIINQPEAAILAMDAVVKRPVVVNGDAIAVRSMMNLSLSFDHRVNDGLQASRFLRSVKESLEAVEQRSPLM